MIRTIGACLILGVSGGFGLAKSIGFRRQSRQLRQLITLLELLRCELNYTLLPLPRLCVLTAERCTGAAAQCLLRYGQELEHCGSRHKAAGLALTETKGLCRRTRGRCSRSCWNRWGAMSWRGRTACCG